MSGHTLTLLPDWLAVCRLDADAGLPSWADGPGFVSITRTAEELSVVCGQDRVPVGVKATPGWRLLKVEGPFDFAVTGVMASLSAPLAAAGVSLFAVATYDTDYLLVKADALDAARAALEGAGHRVRGA